MNSNFLAFSILFFSESFLFIYEVQDIRYVTRIIIYFVKLLEKEYNCKNIFKKKFEEENSNGKNDQRNDSK